MSRSPIILDTDVISEMIRPEPDQTVASWYMEQSNQALHTTSITVAEVSFGLHALPEGVRRQRLTELSKVIFDEGFKGRILPFDEVAAQEYGRMRAAMRRKGRDMAVLDAQIAAIAFSANAWIATRNVTDFEGSGVRVVNPWTA